MKKPIRTPLSSEQLADARRLAEIYKARVKESKARGDVPTLNQAEVGERCEWKSAQSTVSQFMTGKVALNLEALVRLSEALDFEPYEVSPTLAAGIRRAVTDHAKTNHAAEPANSPLPAGEDIQETMDDRYSFIPQYTAYAAAGGGHDNPHVEIRSTLAFKRDWLRLKGANPKNLKVIYADGNSMWPTISDRDVLLVDESKIEPRDGQIFVLESVAKGTIVKRLVKSDFGGWIIRSDNPDKINNADLELPDGEIHEHRILGRVIWRGGDL